MQGTDCSGAHTTLALSVKVPCWLLSPADYPRLPHPYPHRLLGASLPAVPLPVCCWPGRRLLASEAAGACRVLPPAPLQTMGCAAVALIAICSLQMCRQHVTLRAALMKLSLKYRTASFMLTLASHRCPHSCVVWLAAILLLSRAWTLASRTCLQLAGHCHRVGCLFIAVKGSQLLIRTAAQLAIDQGTCTQPPCFRDCWHAAPIGWPAPCWQSKWLACTAPLGVFQRAGRHAQSLHSHYLACTLLLVSVLHCLTHGYPMQAG